MLHHDRLHGTSPNVASRGIEPAMPVASEAFIGPHQRMIIIPNCAEIQGKGAHDDRVPIGCVEVHRKSSDRGRR
jgi:hypothetical protein